MGPFLDPGRDLAANAVRLHGIARRVVVATVLAGCLLTAVDARAAQPLETETARLMPGGRLRLEGTFEYQTSAEGTETSIPMAFEWAILDTLELSIEPIGYTAIRPKVGRSATGIGDTEATLAFRFFEEQPWMPALAAAGEVKLPTARDDLIGTGKADYTFFVIASKRIGDFDTHLNFGYTIVGQPGAVHLDNVFDFAVAEEWHAIPSKLDFVAEFLANTPSVPEAPEGTATGIENAITPEAAGGEMSGMIGARYYFFANGFASLGVSYDNNQAVLFRPGVTVWVN
jgi:hypothetical protein